MTDEKEIKLILQDHEERIKKLEASTDQATNGISQKEHLQSSKEKFKGLNGGINFLMHQGFLNELKSVDEIWAELKRGGYVYPKASVSKLLSVNFVKNKKILNRINEGGVWKYCLRK